MGKAEDILRRREVERRNEHKMSEARRASFLEGDRMYNAQATQTAYDQLQQEIRTTLQWLDDHEWPNGELRRYTGDSTEKRAMCNLNPPHPLHPRPLVEEFLDSEGELHEFTNLDGIRVTLDETAIKNQGAANIDLYTQAVVRLRWLPNRPKG